MIMSGKKQATLQSVQLVDIHGTRFYDLGYTHDDAPTQLRSARIGPEAIYEGPQPGDAIIVSYLMNVAISIARRAS